MMENTFEPNQSDDIDRNENQNSNHKNISEGQPQGREGDPNQNMVKRKDLETEEKELDRRPADVADGNASHNGDSTSSAIAGVQSDQQNANGEAAKPKDENPNHNTEIKNNGDDGDE